MLVSNVLSLYHAAVSRARACDVALGRIGCSNRARRRRPWPLRKKRREMRSVYELAYSTTSSPPMTTYWARAAPQSNRGSPRRCERSLDSQQISERDAAWPVTPPRRRTP